MHSTSVVQRPPAIIIRSQSMKLKLYQVMYATLNKCMNQYKFIISNVEYAYWMEFIVEVIRDEIEGYVKREYSRIPSSTPNSFARYIEKEFNILVAPVFSKIIRKDVNKLKRRAIISESNAEIQCSENTPTCDRRCKVRFNTEENTIHEFERDEVK